MGKNAQGFLLLNICLMAAGMFGLDIFISWGWGFSWGVPYPNMVLPWLVSVNILSFLNIWLDKSLAGRSVVRIPEGVLVFLCFAGGVIGHLAGMHIFRHKTRKASFHAVPFLAAVLYLLVFMALRQKGLL